MELQEILKFNAARIMATLRYSDGSQVSRDMVQQMVTAVKTVADGGAPLDSGSAGVDATAEVFRGAQADGDPPETAPGGHRGPGAKR